MKTTVLPLTTTLILSWVVLGGVVFASDGINTKLASLRRQSMAAEIFSTEVESRYLSLLRDAETDKDRGRVLMELIDVLGAKNGDSENISGYCQQAFLLPLDPLEKCEIVKHWATALQRSKQRQDHDKRIAETYLKGIVLTLEATDADEIREPPPVGKYRYVGSSQADENAKREEHQQEMEARKKVQSDNELLKYRSRFVQECASAFRRIPDGRNQYLLMADKYLKDFKAVRDQLSEMIGK